jgi:hypothetical protein
MKAKVKKNDVEVPFDPALFAATVPARKPTAKDLADVEAHKDDPIEPEVLDPIGGIPRFDVTNSKA